MERGGLKWWVLEMIHISRWYWIGIPIIMVVLAATGLVKPVEKTGSNDSATRQAAPR